MGTICRFDAGTNAYIERSAGDPRLLSLLGAADDSYLNKEGLLAARRPSESANQSGA